MSNKLISILNFNNRWSSDSEGSSESELLLKFKKEYEQSSEFVRNIVYWNTRNSNELDDMVQDVYLKAWKAYAGFNYQSTFKTWIYRITMNTIRDSFKKNSLPTSEYIETAHLDNESGSWPDNQHELQNLVSLGLSQLSLKEREVFILFYKFSYTLKEIAGLLETSVSTVKSRVYKAKGKFEEFVLSVEKDV